MASQTLERMGAALGVKPEHPAKRAVKRAAVKTKAVARKAGAATVKTVSPFPTTTPIGRAFAGYAVINQAGNVAAAGKSVYEGFDEGRNAGYSLARSSAHAVVASAVPLAFAAAPVITTAARLGADKAMAIAKSRGVRSDASMSGLAKGIGTGFKVLGAVSAANNLVQAGLGAYQGASEDQKAVRGAVRGALRTLDPSAVFYERGYAERGYDRIWGTPTTPNASLPARINKAAIDLAMSVPRLVSPHQPRTTPASTENVTGYTRKDGRHVRGYLRRAPTPESPGQMSPNGVRTVSTR